MAKWRTCSPAFNTNMKPGDALNEVFNASKDAFQKNINSRECVYENTDDVFPNLLSPRNALASDPLLFRKHNRDVEWQDCFASGYEPSRL